MLLHDGVSTTKLTETIQDGTMSSFFAEHFYMSVYAGLFSGIWVLLQILLAKAWSSL